jgi:cation-transporting ATPase E
VDKTGTITEPDMKLTRLHRLEGHSQEQIAEALGALYAGRTPDNDTAQALAAAFPKKTPWECKKYIPFTSQTKWCGGVYDGGSFICGAPECILKEKYGVLQERIEAENRLGNRVLLLARYAGSLEEPLQDRLAEPMALLVLTNPIRENAVKTFTYFKEQGVTIKVISGDNPQTVSAVATQAQIEGGGDYIDARTLITDEDIYRAAERYTVFGRVTPEQKKKLIKALKEQGHTVAMTGDGVNDVLAMKQADCGVAMASGAAACSQVAQLVLTESDFGAMPYIVGEGRRVINNIQRAAALFLVKNIMSLFVAVLTMAIGFAYPFQPIQMTMISALTIGVPAFFFAMEPNYQRVKGKFLPTVLRNALPGGLTNVLAVLFAQRYLTAQGVLEGDISTLCVTVLSTVGLLVLLQVSRPVSPFRLLVLGAMGIAMAGCFLIPFLSVIFDLGILELSCLQHLWVILPVAAGIFLLLTGIFALLDRIKGRK